MNKADQWLGTLAPNPQAGNTELRGNDTARLINARPSSIVITRNLDDGTVVQLAPQTVRVEVVQSIRDSGENRDALVAISKQYVVIIGYKDCPGIPDTNILRGDMFFYQQRMYEIEELIDTIPGRLMASGDLTP